MKFVYLHLLFVSIVTGVCYQSAGFIRQDPPAILCPQVSLWSQLSSVDPWEIISQNLSDPLYDNQAADDFLNPGVWSVYRVIANGSYADHGPSDSVNVYFYTNNVNLPGTLINSYLGITNYVDNNGYLDITLPTPQLLTSGTYWVSVQVNKQDSYWQWIERTTQNLSPNAWKNPGNGFGTGCTNWQPTGNCFTIERAFPDLNFALVGCILAL